MLGLHITPRLHLLMTHEINAGVSTAVSSNAPPNPPELAVV